MVSWFKWLLPSALVAAGLTGLSGVIAFRPIADDVVGRTTAQLKAEGFGWASLTTSGRDLTLSGDAPDPNARRMALEAADRVFGVRVVADNTSVLPLATPYAFAIERDGNKISLTGVVPSDAARKALLAAVAKTVPGAVVEDRLTLARGASEAWPAASAFALAQLAGLTKGKVALSDGAYSISGNPVDFATYRKLEGELASALPSGIKLAADTLVAPAPKPYRLGITAANGGLTLDGFLPDAASKEKLLAGLKAAFAGQVEDRTLIAPGAPSGFLDAVLAVLPGVARLKNGGLELADGTLKIAGSAPTGAVGEQIRAWILAHLPKGFSLGGADLAVAAPPVVAPDECRRNLTMVQSSGKIRFETGKAILDADDTRLLDALVVAALQCGTARVTVEGHTDNVGDADANTVLSEKRAGAVVDYLVAAGIAADRLTAKGFGDTKAIADNGTDEGKQHNRRIDFTVE